MDVLRFGQEPGRPDTVSVFQLFIWEAVGFCLGFEVRFVWSEGGFIIVCILHKGWEWSSLTGIDLADVLFPSIAFLLKFSLTAHTATG